MINEHKSLYIWSVWSRFTPWLLALSWILGMLLGIPAAIAASDFFVPMMRQSVGCSVSIPGLLAATVLPFLLSAFVVSLSQPWLLLVISLFKAFSFSFCACGVTLAFGQCSWLVRFLFLFSDHCLIPVLYWYWVRQLQRPSAASAWELWGCVGTAVLIGFIDYYHVAPLLVSLV